MVFISSQIKGGFGRLLLLFAGTLLGVLICEMLLRVALFSPLIKPHPCSPMVNSPRYLIMPDPAAGYTLRPYFQGEEVNPYGDFQVPVVINALGLRDGRLHARIAPEAYRILMLGDSMTYGMGVTWEDSYPARLEKILNRQGPLSVQVFNGGVPGYSLGQMLARLKDYQTRLRPHLVTVCWLPPLWGREITPMQYRNGYLIEPEQAGKISVIGANLFHSSFPPQSRRAHLDIWLQSHWFTYFFLRYQVRFRLDLYLSNLAAQYARKESLDTPVYLPRPLEIIGEMADSSRENGSEFALILLLSNPQVTQEIRQFCQAKNIALLSLAERAFFVNSPYREFIYPHDPHFNRNGHAYLADQLGPFLLQIRSKGN